MKSEARTLTANCISQRTMLLNLTFINKSFVPLLSLFLMRMICNFYRVYRLILCSSLYSLIISFSFEENLQRIRSPILKVRRLAGDGQLGYSPILLSS
jgi:hypothetical protein